MTFDPAWEAIHRARAWGRWPNEAFVRFAMRTYGDAPDRSAVKFLELGCGAGAQVAFLAEEGFSVTGIDGSSIAVSRARGLCHQRHVTANAGFYEMDLAELFVASPFDCILDICTLQHLPDDDAAAIIAKARGWLKPGGRFFSVMLDSADGYAFPAPIYPRDEKGVAALFDGYDLRVGYQYESRPDDTKLAHWIIEAQVAP